MSFVSDNDRSSSSFSRSVCLDDNQITDELIDRLVQQASIEVNRAVAETVRHLQDRRRPRTPGDLMSLMKFPKPLQLTLAKTEDIFERALDLVHRYVDNITFSSDASRNAMHTTGNRFRLVKVGKETDSSFRFPT